MKKTLLLILLLGLQLAFSQTLQKEESQIQTDSASGIQKLSDTMVSAEFPGGLSALRNHIGNEFKTSNLKGTGIFKSVTKFLILPDGSMSAISTTGNSPAMNQEMTRVMRTIKKKWKPATRNGQPVESTFRMPMTISMD